MDVFRFHNPTAPTKMEWGHIVDGLTSKMWVERYDKAGEFKFTANGDFDVKNLLPVGSFISHLDSKDIMLVENHEISEEQGKESSITISGRGIETILEERIVGSNKTFPTSNGTQTLTIVSAHSSEQVVAIIAYFIQPAGLVDDDNVIPYISLLNDVPTEGIAIAREVKRGDLYSRILEFLAIDNLGIKVIRPGIWSPLGLADPNVALIVHKGIDRSSQITFSYDAGEIQSADYLWSIKAEKNAAYIHGKWVETFVSTGPTGYDRRVLEVEAEDLDNSFSTPPTGTALTDIVNKMQQRGRDALAAQNEVILTKAELGTNLDQVKYRRDFNIGDIVTIRAKYNASTKMRVTEYVEIEDENGRVEYPTLAAVE